MLDHAPLVGTAWRIIEIAGEAIESTTEGRPARLSFLDGDDGARFAASAGCNNIMGSYQLDGAALTFGPAATTMMMCEEPLMRRERALIDAFTSAHAYMINGDALALLDATGAVLVRAEVSASEE